MEDLIAILVFFAVAILSVLKKVFKAKVESAPEGEKPKQHIGAFFKKALETLKEKAREDQARRARAQGEEQSEIDKGFFAEFLSYSEGGKGAGTAEATKEETFDILFSPSVNEREGSSGFSGAAPLFAGEEEPNFYSQPSGAEPPSPPASKRGETDADKDAHGEALYRYDKAALRNAVVWSEILAPPMALRDS